MPLTKERSLLIGRPLAALRMLVPLALLLACGAEMNSLDQTAIEQQRAASTRGASPPVTTGGPNRCENGTVSSEGAVGGPLEGVRVRVYFDDEPTEGAVTDRTGAFRVCLGDRKGHPRVRLEIDLAGYEHVETAFTFDGRNDKKNVMNITLRRSQK